MATAEQTRAEVLEQADAEEVLRLVAEGKRVTDPNLRRRIQERADVVRREMPEKHGVTNIAAELTDHDE
jgi:hypothetical protein